MSLVAEMEVLWPSGAGVGICCVVQSKVHSMLFSVPLDDLLASTLQTVLLVVGTLWIVALVLLALLPSVRVSASFLGGLEGTVALAGGAIAVLVSVLLLPALFDTSASVSEVVLLAAKSLGMVVLVFLGCLSAVLVLPQMRKPQGDRESLIGMVGIVRHPVSGGKGGQVFVDGERWQALAEDPGAEPLPIGAEVEVTGFKHEAVMVRAVEPQFKSKGA